MKWSRYNCLFETKNNGWLLYNSGSNAFSELDSDTHLEVEKIRKDPEVYDFTRNPMLFFQLRNGGYLVEDGQDDDLYNLIKMRRISQDYASPYLSLTIAPTRECNFACPYCYEPDRDPVYMSDKTEDNIIKFINNYSRINKIFITWYGGEPLMAFDRISSMNKKIIDSGKDFESMIITNGYYLTEDVIRELENLRTNRIQVTLDGSEKTHNLRRFLIGGGETFQTILGNLDRLMNSSWDGRVSLRVNVDNINENEYKDVHYFIKERYGEKYGDKILVYPGFVHADGVVNPDTSCCFDNNSKAEFIVKQHCDYGIDDLNLFPRKTYMGCIAHRRNGFVIGPEGEVYKCWDDMGIEDMVIGNIGELTNWNMSLVAEYMVGSSFLNSEECKKCFFFPICDGGCAHMRMLSMRDGKKRDHCSYFKAHLKELLELHYIQKKSQEKSSALGQNGL